MPFLVKEGVITEGQTLDNAWLSKAIDILKERSRTLIELAKSLRYYIASEVEYDKKAKAKFLNVKSHDMLIELQIFGSSRKTHACPKCSYIILTHTFSSIVSTIINTNAAKAGE